MSRNNTMISNFTNNYGISGLERIIELFQLRTSNQAIAQEFGVTRQRIHQWQQSFTITKVNATPEILELLIDSY